jgi:adenylylsulfate kinase-like enzyme
MRGYCKTKTGKKLKHFYEVYLNCPVDVRVKRDYKGNYNKAFKGLYENFVGVIEPYQVSAHPELILNTAELSIDEASLTLLEKVLVFLSNK